MYLFSHKHNWSKLEDEHPFTNETEDFEKALEHAGYKRSLDQLHERMGFEIHIYECNQMHVKYVFIAELIIADTVYYVALPELPDLMEFLRLYSVSNFDYNLK